LFLALVISAMAGGIMALCWGAFGGFLREMFTGASELVFEWKTGGDTGMSLANPLKRKMPYVPAIAIGTLVSFFSR
jgi:prepilin peptidase CpaA